MTEKQKIIHERTYFKYGIVAGLCEMGWTYREIGCYLLIPSTKAKAVSEKAARILWREKHFDRSDPILLGRAYILDLFNG